MSIYDKFVHEICRQYIKKGNSVFDCGCGDGTKTKILQQYSENVTAGDLDNRAKLCEGVPFILIKPDYYGEPNQYDVVASFDVIEHVEDDAGFLKEITKILKPGGIGIIGTPNRNRISNQLTALVKGKIEYPRNLGYHYESGGDIIHLREYTSADLEQLVGKIQGAQLIEVKEGFIGAYTPWGGVGFKSLNPKIFKKYAQHLFLIFRKVGK